MFPGKESYIEMSNHSHLEYVNCTLSFSLDFFLLLLLLFLFSLFSVGALKNIYKRWELLGKDGTGKLCLHIQM